MKEFLREPFFHFMVLGLLIFVANAILSDRKIDESEIIITSDDVNRLKTTYFQNWNREADSVVLEQLIKDYVDSEILYQEALKLGLDHNDEIIKRRLRQKLEFIAGDLSDAIAPKNKELEAFYNEDKYEFITEPHLTFYQYYISPDVHENPKERADDLYPKLRLKTHDEVEINSDPFFMPPYFESVSRSNLERKFGLEFAKTLCASQNSGWQKPIRSGYGYHLVYLETIDQQRQLSFEEAYDDVLYKWKRANKNDLNQLLIENMRTRYNVIYDF